MPIRYLNTPFLHQIEHETLREYCKQSSSIIYYCLLETQPSRSICYNIFHVQMNYALLSHRQGPNDAKESKLQDFIPYQLNKVVTSYRM